MELKDRLLRIASHYGLSVREFERQSGLNRGNISNMTGALGTDKAAKIIAAFPEVNLYWLISGRGNMFAPANAERRVKVAYGFDDMSGGGTAFSDASLMYNGESVSARGTRLRLVPLYDLDLADGLSPLFKDANAYSPTDNIYIPGLPECDGAVRVRGKAMYPLLGNGDIVLYKKIDDISGVVWGEMYILSIATGGEDEYVTVRYIDRSVLGAGHILLKSYGDQQSPMEVPVASVKALAIVKASVRFNTMR